MYHVGNLIFHGKPVSLKTLEVMLSEGELSDRLSNILRDIGAGLEVISVNSGGICWDLDVELSSIKSTVSICWDQPDFSFFCS
ncbi:uncharacterized protein BDW43DRAFT_292777 [Aspergillus alliaceus]|uniref:uncharacterized protein n=1 Tax=Petromyces alliaceus TaxID=209559 RepID=UPI0012A5C9A9|nr:uncharacterized protein BDW43DRAFT_292777 [Aspergillus alliaceus]KAB8227902.1 hypothetical protein BDW43DRAFT_292777 [Aspergillus alliaceus]